MLHQLLHLTEAKMSTHPFYLLDWTKTIETQKPEEWLGKVVADYENPENHSAPKSTASFRGEVKSDPGYRDVAALLKSKRGTSIETALANVFKASANRSRSTLSACNAAKVEHLKITEHPDVFEKLRANQSALAEIKKLEWTDRQAYLVVGLLVTENISYGEDKSAESRLSVEAKVPTKEASMAVGLPPVDVPLETKAEDTAEDGHKGGLGLVGKRIFAIQYRILRKHRITKSKRIDLTEDSMKGEYVR